MLKNEEYSEYISESAEKLKTAYAQYEDMVKVVRCGACKYSFRFTDQDGNKFLLCCGKIGSRELKDTDFCSYGEKRNY